MPEPGPARFGRKLLKMTNPFFTAKTHTPKGGPVSTNQWGGRHRVKILILRSKLYFGPSLASWRLGGGTGFRMGLGLFFLILSGLVSTAHADLQWITGSVPKNTLDSGANATVKDAPAAAPVSGASSDQGIIISHMITCTKIANDYPNDSVNYLYLNKNDQVCFYLYFLIKPASRIHTVSVQCFNPSGIQIAKYDQEYRVSFVDRLLTVQDDTYQWFLTTMTLGMDHLRSEYGQTGLPKDTGLYSFKTSVDGQLVGITFFYVKDQPIQSPSPISPAPVSPAAAAAAQSVGAVSIPGAFPMSTPISSQPISRNIP
jgi:hypothetical protein